MDNQKLYKALYEKTNTIRDRQNTPMDEGIKSIVAALWLHGFLTSSSCAGHVDSMSQGPYIHIIPADFDAKYNLFNELIDDDSIADARLIKAEIYDSSLVVYTRLFTILRLFYEDKNIDYDHLLVAYAQLNGEIYLYFNDVRISDSMNNDDRRDWLIKCHRELHRLKEFLLTLPVSG
jgi:hypothetical protein